MQTTLSSAYVQTLERQLDVMARFSLASDMMALRGIWRDVHGVLEASGVEFESIGSFPNREDERQGFQESVMTAVRPRLSGAMIELFGDPTPHVKVMLGKMSLQRVWEIYRASVLDITSGNMLIASALLYHQFGSQLDVAAEYFTLRTTASKELMWRMKMLFVIHGESTNVLNMIPAVDPHNAYQFSVSVRNMISPHLERTLDGLLSRGIGKDVLTQEHAITMERIERAASAGLIMSSTRTRAERILRPAKVGFLSRLLGRE